MATQSNTVETDTEVREFRKLERILVRELHVASDELYAAIEAVENAETVDEVEGIYHAVTDALVRTGNAVGEWRDAMVGEES